MNHPPDSVASALPIAVAAQGSARAYSRAAVWLLLLAAAVLLASLLWDFSWESTVGIDRVWAPAHTAGYLAVALAGGTALVRVFACSRDAAGGASGVRLGRLHAPLGVWLTLWGALGFLAAVLFDRWWQSSYGLAAGIWHPPQILKAISFFAVVAGAWLAGLHRQNNATAKGGPGRAFAFAVGGGLMLALITIVSLTSIYPNRQHSAPFYQFACGTYPVVLVASTVAGKVRWPATIAAAAYLGLICLLVWVLPLFPASPQVAPVYNQLDHLMPPPFPLLLVAPAAVLDALFQRFPWPANRARPWLQAFAAGLAFLLVFAGTQWIFSEFLLTDLAENRFFAGGGQHWPFFLKIDPLARTAFWESPQDEFNPARLLGAAALSVVSAGAGVWAGAWMARLRR